MNTEKTISLIEPTESDKKMFISLYLRFLKERNLYKKIKNAVYIYIKKYERNRECFKLYNTLINVDPINYFAISPSYKKWRWDDVNISRTMLSQYNSAWVNYLINNSKYKNFYWRNYS